jgi:DNA-directed RNA polymerase, mitochondrial
VSSEDLDELNHALEKVVRADPKQQAPPTSSLGRTGEAGRGRRQRGMRGRLASETAAEHGMKFHKYTALRRRQIRIETEAWEQAAKEYRELLADMCEQKLAPNLPYVKSLFLGWFEPLRDQIIMEQELVAERGSRAPHGPYFNMLPADMMAVITMHKLMGLLMTGNSDGSVRVIQAACQIGEAIEHEVC